MNSEFKENDQNLTLQPSPIVDDYNSNDPLNFGYKEPKDNKIKWNKYQNDSKLKFHQKLQKKYDTSRYFLLTYF